MIAVQAEKLPPLQTFIAREGVLEYAVFQFLPSKPLIIVIHGLGGNAHSAKYISPLIQEKYSVVGISLPHHGQTTLNSLLKTNSDIFSSLIIQFINELKKTFDFPYCNLCAHSLGAVFAIQIAISDTKIFKNIVLIAPAGYGYNDKLFFRLAQTTLGKWLLKQDLFLQYLASKLWETDDDYARRIFMNQLKNIFLATAEFDLITNKKVHLFYGISSSVSIIWAKDDLVLPYNYSAEAKNHFQRSTVLLLNNGGHNLLKSRAEYIAQHLLDLLKMG